MLLKHTHTHFYFLKTQQEFSLACHQSKTLRQESRRFSQLCFIQKNLVINFSAGDLIPLDVEVLLSCQNFIQIYKEKVSLDES